MGNFRIIVEAVGGHGCQRASERVDQTKPIYWCMRQTCPDCIAREFAEKIHATCSDVKARILHWPDKDGNVVDGTVVDELEFGKLEVNHYTNSDGTSGSYASKSPTVRHRSKPM